MCYSPYPILPTLCTPLHSPAAQGEKEKNLVADVHDFLFLLPTLEYHNQTWTWLDLLMTMKNDSKRVLLSQVHCHSGSSSHSYTVPSGPHLTGTLSPAVLISQVHCHSGSSSHRYTVPSGPHLSGALSQWVLISQVRCPQRSSSLRYTVTEGPHLTVTLSQWVLISQLDIISTLLIWSVLNGHLSYRKQIYPKSKINYSTYSLHTSFRILPLCRFIVRFQSDGYTCLISGDNICLLFYLPR